MRILAFLLTIILLLAVPAKAATFSGDRITLADGTDFRLQGITAPTDPALADAAAARLAELTLGQKVTLRPTGSDRYGRITGDILTAQAESVQVILLREGLALMHPMGDIPENIPALQKTEATARKAKVGIWHDPTLIYDACCVWPAYGRFALVQGTVREAVRIKNKVYLNFGADWREDFTIQIAAADLRNLKESGLDPLTLTGKKLLARGWISAQNGPMLNLQAAWQLAVGN